MIYIGVGGSGEMSLRNAESAKRVLNSTFLVQEYVEGGNLRNQVLEQVTPLPLLQCFSGNVHGAQNAHVLLKRFLGIRLHQYKDALLPLSQD